LGRSALRPNRVYSGEGESFNVTKMAISDQINGPVVAWAMWSWSG